MGILDLFKSAPAPPITPRGDTGRGNYHGFLNLEELNRDLQGPTGLRVFDRMYRTDPDVRRVVSMVTNPILGGDWEVEPFGGEEATPRDQEIADAVRWALFEHMRPGLLGHLHEALPILVRSGFCPFEQIWGRGTFNGQELLAPRKLALKLPRSIFMWFQDDLGDLAMIRQFSPSAGQVDYPARDLIYYRVGMEGDNWEGTSLLRPAYKPWFIKDKSEMLDALGVEREAMGIPVGYPPNGATQDQKDAFEEVLANIRGGDQGYILMPGPNAAHETEAGGWFFEIAGFGGGSGGSGRDASKTLKYHSDKIATVFVAEFIRLGQDGVGARATADTQQEPFEAGIRALAGLVEGPLNEELIPRFVALNFKDAKGSPKLRMVKADGTTLDVLGTFVSQMIAAEAIHPDDQAEDYLRMKADLPAADPKARAERKAQEQKQQELQQKTAEAALEQPKPTPDKPATTAATLTTLARQPRELRHYEQRMSLDSIEQAIDGARARFEQAAGPAARDAAVNLAADLADGGDPSTEPPQELVDAIEGELASLYTLGRMTVSDELDRQRSAGHAAGYAATDLPVALARRALVAARALMSQIFQAISHQALTGRKQHADLQAAGEQAAMSGLRAQAQLHAAPALNDGRSDEADAHADEISGTYYTSILDPNTCGPCGRSDDDVLRPLTDPVRLARKPPNPSCEGGSRCRCLEAYVLRTEAPTGA